MSNVIPQKVVVVPNLATFQSTGIAGYQGSQAQIAYLQGTVTELDGGQGFYQLADNDFQTSENPPTVIVDGAGNRWFYANVSLTAAAIIALLTGTPLPIVAGGTGQATAGAALDALTIQGANIAAAATTNLATATGEFVVVTGNGGPITALGTATAGIFRFVRFTGTPTLTYNATSLILPGAANITVAAGDTALFISLGSGNWVCSIYERASGLVLPAAFASAAQAADTTDTTHVLNPQNLMNIGTARLLWRLTNADLNSTADQAFTKIGTYTSFIYLTIISSYVSGANPVNTAQGGLYTAASKTGTTIVAATQAYSNNAGAGTGTRMTSNVAGAGSAGGLRSDSALFLSLTTPQGGAAVADFYVFGYALS